MSLLKFWSSLRGASQDDKERELFAQIRKREDAEREAQRRGQDFGKR